VLAPKRVFLALHGPLHSQLVDVSACDESLLACTGDDYRTHGGITLQFEDNSPEFINRGGVECVEDLRAVDRDDGGRAISLEKKIVKAHRARPARLYQLI
jgi:hypothetical protein